MAAGERTDRGGAEGNSKVGALDGHSRSLDSGTIKFWKLRQLAYFITQVLLR